MSWLTLGMIDLSGEKGLNWQTTLVSATEGDLFRFTFLLNGGQWEKIYFSLFVERVWNSGEIREQNRLIIPTPEKVLLSWPIPPNYAEAGLDTYKIRVKKRYRYFKYVITEPNYSVLVEVQQ